MSKFGSFGGAFQSRINRFYKDPGVADFRKEVAAEGFGNETAEKTLRDVFSEGEKTQHKTPPKTGMLPQQPTAQSPLQEAILDKQEIFSGTPSTKQKVLGIA